MAESVAIVFAKNGFDDRYSSSDKSIGSCGGGLRNDVEGKQGSFFRSNHGSDRHHKTKKISKRTIYVVSDWIQFGEQNYHVCARTRDMSAPAL